MYTGVKKCDDEKEKEKIEKVVMCNNKS